MEELWCTTCMVRDSTRLDITTRDGDDEKRRATAGMCAVYSVWCYGSWCRVSRVGEILRGFGCGVGTAESFSLMSRQCRDGVEKRP